MSDTPVPETGSPYHFIDHVHGHKHERIEPVFVQIAAQQVISIDSSVQRGDILSGVNPFDCTSVCLSSSHLLLSGPMRVSVGPLERCNGEPT